MPRSHLENEIKLAILQPARLRQRLRALGYEIKSPRRRELNWIYDDAAGHWTRQGRLLRLRHYGGRWLLTAKGPLLPGAHKTRREAQMELPEGRSFQALAETLGLKAVIRYEKYRTLWRHPRIAGEIAWDETAAGDFLELEGTPSWVNRTARALGYTPGDYIGKSYLELLHATVKTSPE